MKPKNLDIRLCYMNSNLGILFPVLHEICTSYFERIALMSAQPNNSPANFIPQKRYKTCKLFKKLFQSFKSKDRGFYKQEIYLKPRQESCVSNSEYLE